MRCDILYLLQGSTLQERLQAQTQLAVQQAQLGLVRAAVHMRWDHMLRMYWDHTLRMRGDHNHSMPHSLWGSILRQHMGRLSVLLLLTIWT